LEQIPEASLSFVLVGSIVSGATEFVPSAEERIFNTNSFFMFRSGHLGSNRLPHPRGTELAISSLCVHLTPEAG
jgi:hypothetical protein